jgi:hypothetical protein
MAPSSGANNQFFVVAVLRVLRVLRAFVLNTAPEGRVTPTHEVQKVHTIA